MERSKDQKKLGTNYCPRCKSQRFRLVVAVLVNGAQLKEFGGFISAINWFDLERTEPACVLKSQKICDDCGYRLDIGEELFKRIA